MNRCLPKSDLYYQLKHESEDAATVSDDIAAIPRNDAALRLHEARVIRDLAAELDPTDFRDMWVIDWLRAEAARREQPS